MDANYPGKTLRTRDAIEQTSVVVLGTLVEPGTVSPGPPGAHDIDDATFRVERMLTPERGGQALARNVKVSYTRQVFPESLAEAALERGAKYVLFCKVHTPARLHALKVVPHSEEAVRVVASAFGSGARHQGVPSGDRIA